VGKYNVKHSGGRHDRGQRDYELVYITNCLTTTAVSDRFVVGIEGSCLREFRRKGFYAAREALVSAGSDSGSIGGTDD
jgi:hypothetical protein